MKVFFDKLANLELDDATEFYDLEVPGLGTRFREEVKRGIRRICDYPLAWTKETEGVRRYILHNFPYKILYSPAQESGARSWRYIAFIHRQNPLG